MSPKKIKKIGPALVFLLGIVGMISALRRLDVLWLMVGSVSFMLILGMIKIKEVSRLKWELVILLLIPLFLGLSGISVGLKQYLYGIDLAFVIVAPIIGFMLMFNLHHHTKFRSNFPFTIFFVVIFSLSSGALIGIGEFVSDQHLGTEYLESNFQLMINLLVIAIGGVLMALFFRAYLKKSNYRSVKSLTSPLDVDSVETTNAVSHLLYSGFGKKGHTWAPLFSRFLQLLILVFAMYAVYERNPRWFFSAILSFGVTMIPYLFTRNMKVVIPPLLNLWITVALFLHVLGGVMGYYDHVWWWDNLTHFISAALISILGFTILLTISRLSGSLYVPPIVVPALIILFILATGVVWEIFEFFCDQLLGTNMQYSLQDTVYDMMFNTVGALFASIIGYRYFLKEHWET